jgi:hypothetical protein
MHRSRLEQELDLILGSDVKMPCICLSSANRVSQKELLILLAFGG